MNRLFGQAMRIWQIAGLGLLIMPWLFSAEPTQARSSAAPAPAGIYVANKGNNNIIRANLDLTSGTNLGALGCTLNGPTGIALDVGGGKAYITNITSNTLVRANLDGSGCTALTLSGSPPTLDGLAGIALDQLHGKMYIANSNVTNIIKANLDGTGAAALTFGGNINFPWGIALDIAGNKVYVTNYTGSVSYVTIGDLNGTYQSNLNLSGCTLDLIAGIALDSANGKAYIANDYLGTGGHNNLLSAALNGAGCTSLGSLGGMNGPNGVAISSSTGKMLVTSWLSNQVFEANIPNGASPTNSTLAALLNQPQFIGVSAGPTAVTLVSVRAAETVAYGGWWAATAPVMTAISVWIVRRRRRRAPAHPAR